MLVSELKQEITKLKSEGSLKNQMVEFVIDTKKHYVSDIKAGADTMIFKVARTPYTGLQTDELCKALDQANNALEAKIINADNNQTLAIDSLHCGQVFLEIAAQLPE